MKQICILCAEDSHPKNTIRDGGSTALYAAYTVDMVFTVDTVYTVDMVFTVDMVYTIDTVDNVDNVDTVGTVDNVDAVDTVDTALHYLNSSMYAYIYC